jgi:hypothetical protein
MSGELEVRNITDLQQGQASPDELRQRMERMTEMIKLKAEFLRNNLKEGIEADYAVIPGCGDKKVLLKPGAEKLLDWHGYYPSFVLISEKEDWDIGLFAYVYECTIKQRGSNIIIATQQGDCSTMESKYRFEWKYLNQIPKDVNADTLTKREIGKNKTVQYRFLVENPADKRNTIRKMSQKRALLGATVLATATSSLFATDIEPDDDDQGAGATGNTTTNGDGQKSHPDYGKVISDPQAKRAFAKAKSANIDIDKLNAWLKVAYGFENINAIGWKAYEEICKIIDTGKLPAVEPEKPQGDSASSGAKLSVAQIKHLNDGLKVLGKTDAEFTEWLKVAFPHYENIKTTNDIASEEYSAIIGAVTKAVEGKLI